MPLSPLHRALSFALKAHSGADREGESPLPYFTHPMEVLQNLRYVGGVTDPDLLCAAVLHDVVEESPVHLAEIRSQFGDRIADLVVELTRQEPSVAEIQGMDKAQIWNLRSQMLLAEIARMSPDAQQVKLADRLSNLREAKRTKRAEKLKRYISQTRRVLEIIPESVNPGLWQAIRREL
jgi:(p)ppGpp synthase/HD superfamily hydrolase